MTITTDKNGAVDVESVRNATPDSLKRWITDRLNARDLVAAEDAGAETRNVLIEEIYDQLGPFEGARIRHVVRQLLTDLASRRLKNWTEDASALLVQLAETVSTGTSDEPEVVGIAMLLASRKQSPLVVRRSLQLIAGTHQRLDPSYWDEKFKDPADAATVLEGLGNYSVDAAFDFVARHSSLASVRDATEFLLNLWISRYGQAEVTDAVNRMLSHLDQDAADWLIGTARANGLTVHISFASRIRLFSQRAGKFRINFHGAQAR